MSSVSQAAARGRTRPRRGRVRLALPVVLIATLACLAAGYLVHTLWSRWPSYQTAPDAPEIPLSVGGVVFNVPPGAVRNRVQRRTGAHERVDLAFLWPSLEPPMPRGASSTGPRPVGTLPGEDAAAERIFVTIASIAGTLSPAERLQTIYPRYAESAASAGPDGLAVLAFREGTPYHGEDLIYDPSAPEQFLARCTRRAGAAPGTCISERRVGTADVTLRFPRGWLDDWRSVKAGLDRLIARMRPTAG